MNFETIFNLFVIVFDLIGIVGCYYLVKKYNQMKLVYKTIDKNDVLTLLINGYITLNQARENLGLPLVEYGDISFKNKKR